MPLRQWLVLLLVIVGLYTTAIALDWPYTSDEFQTRIGNVDTNPMAAWYFEDHLGDRAKAEQTERVADALDLVHNDLSQIATALGAMVIQQAADNAIQSRIALALEAMGPTMTAMSSKLDSQIFRQTLTEQRLKIVGAAINRTTAAIEELPH